MNSEIAASVLTLDYGRNASYLLIDDPLLWFLLVVVSAAIYCIPAYLIRYRILKHPVNKKWHSWLIAIGIYLIIAVIELLIALKIAPHSMVEKHTAWVWFFVAIYILQRKDKEKHSIDPDIETVPDEQFHINSEINLNYEENPKNEIEVEDQIKKELEIKRIDNASLTDKLDRITEKQNQIVALDVKPTMAERVEDKKISDEIEKDEPSPEIKFCRKCGTRLREGALFCDKCGTKILR